MPASLPGTHWLADIEFRKKFWLIIALFSLPMLYSAWFIFQAENKAISKASSQQLAAQQNYQLLKAHNQSIKDQLLASKSGQPVNWSQHIPASVDAQTSQRLQKIATSSNGDVARFRQWMQQLEQALESQALTSGLLLDQHQQTVVIGQLQSIDIPRFASVLAALTSHAVNMARAGQFSPDGYIGLSQLFNQAMIQQEALDNKIMLLDESLQQSWRNYQQTTSAYLSEIQREFIDSDSLSASAGSLFSQGQQVANNMMAFDEQLHAEFQQQNEQHLQQSSTRLLTSAAIFVIMAGIAVYLLTAVNLSLSNNIQQVARMADDIEHGRLAGGYPQSGKDELGHVVNSLAIAINQMRETVCAITDNTRNLSSTSTQLNDSAHQLSDLGTSQKQKVERITVAASSLQDSAQLVDQLCRDAEQESHNTQETAQSSAERSEQSATVIRNLATTIRDAADRISALAAQTAEIAGVTDVIKTIAEQTNLLALNAAIEATRAGEQGRGFAVVADEVRTLATRTQESTEEIESTIGSLQTVAEEAVVAMNNACEQANQGEQESLATGEAMTSILSSMASINGVIQQLTSAGTQQAQVANDISQNIYQVDESATGLLTQSQEVAASANAVSQQSNNLSQQSSRFTV